MEALCYSVLTHSATEYQFYSHELRIPVTNPFTPLIFPMCKHYFLYQIIPVTQELNCLVPVWMNNAPGVWLQI